MAPESLDLNDRKAVRFSPHLLVMVFLLVVLIFWVKKQAISAGQSVEATGTEGGPDPVPQHSIPFAHWDVFDGDGTDPPEYFWGKDDFNPKNGNYSAWCARDGANGLDPANFFYPANADSWMVYGPFSLENFDEAVLEYSYSNKSEEDYDFFHYLASLDGVNFRGDMVSGDSNGWQIDLPLDLSQVPQLGDLTGLPSVWIAFRFTSDESNSDMPFPPDGAFVDDIALKARKTSNDEWEILMSEDFEGEFPPVLNLESSYLPVVTNSGS